ncbi:MAG: class I SAM-dependent methyltransferase, partial [Candidatus Aenigmarchaeota archaeon]|nr:class I SAM-dependent methyltransferase [Candidatus Aenigmarchaeota archaeon]
FSIRRVEDTKFRNNFFDAIFCFHVVEHLEMPEQCIDEFHRILKPGGLLLIETPHWVSAITPVGYKFYSDPTHKKPFSKKSLRALLERKFLVKQLKFDSPVYFYLKRMSGYRKFLDAVGLYRTVVWAEAEKAIK